MALRYASFRAEDLAAHPYVTDQGLSTPIEPQAIRPETAPDVRHGFVNERRDAFDEATAADAWRRVLALFAANL